MRWALIDGDGGADRRRFVYLVELKHAEAAHFGFDVFADVFGRRQEAPFRLNTTSTETEVTQFVTPVCAEENELHT